MALSPLRQILYFELPRWLAGSSQVRTGAGCSQGAVAQPLRVPRVDHQPAQESAVAQTASCLSGNNFGLRQMWAWITLERSLTIQRLAASLKPGTTRPLKVFQRLLGLMAAAASVIPLGLLHMWPLQFWLKARIPPHTCRLGRLPVRVDHRCIKAVAPWTTSRLFQTGIRLGLTFRRKVITTDASNSGWGALLEGNPAFGSWSAPEQCLHIEGWEPERRKWHFTNFTEEPKLKFYQSLICLCVLISIVYNKNVYTHGWQYFCQ